MQLFAPAKINLSLQIRGRRPDGFHEIETLMAPISLHDTLTIERVFDADGVQLKCDDPAVPAGEDNLVVRAADAFFAAVRLRAGVRIELEKKIPHGAGLGGGSSDAAATLLGLNEIFGTGLPRDRLIQLAAEIGSDVPFFILRSAAWSCGRGEAVTPARIGPAIPLLLLKPAFGVSTAWAYARWQDSRKLPGVDYEKQSLEVRAFVNDLERPVFEKFVFLARLKMWLREQPEVAIALLSGSGSTVFAVLHGDADAEKLAARARAELDPLLWTWPCTTLAD